MALRALLGRRRYRVALLSLGRGLTQVKVARRLRIGQGTVSKDLAFIRAMFKEQRVSPGRCRSLRAAHAVPGLN